MTDCGQADARYYDRAPVEEPDQSNPSTSGSTPEAEAHVDVDALVAQLRARVEERRRAGEYPPGLEDDLAEHFQRILRQRGASPPSFDLQGQLEALRASLPLERARIAVDSDLPGGQALHRAVAKAVGRQTEGVLQQVQGFAQPATDLLASLVATVESLKDEIRTGLIPQVDAVLERQATQERALVGVRVSASTAAPRPSKDGRVGNGPVLTLEKGEGLGPLMVREARSLGGLAVTGAIEHLTAEEVVDLVALAAEKVRPGGRVVVEMGSAPQPFHPAELSFLFSEAGFAAIAIQWRAAAPADGEEERLEHQLFTPPGYLVIATR